MKSNTSQLGYVGLEVSDEQTWRGFATEVLGMEPQDPGDQAAQFYRIDANHHRLALHQGPADDLAYVGWQVDDDAALESLATRLEALGSEVQWGTPEQAEARKVERLFRTVDPSGTPTEVYCGATVLESPFQSPSGVSGFKAGGLGLGHIVLCVEDLEQALRFYADGLGLKLSDFIDIDLGGDSVLRAAFLHAGPRHHSLALLPMPAPRRLHHLMLEVTDIDDVGRAFDACVEKDIPIVRSLGRHTNDKMVSFYMQAPSGFEVEFGHGGVLIDDATWEVQTYNAPSIWGHRPLL